MIVFHLGHAAIDLLSPLWIGDLVRASNVQHLNGQPYRPGDLLVCDTCGDVIRLAVRGEKVLALSLKPGDNVLGGR